MSINGIEYTKEELLDIFKQCTTFTQVLFYFGFKQNGSGQRFIKKLREELNIPNDFFKKEKEKLYCTYCGKEITGKYDKRRKFCSRRCAAIHRNINYHKEITNEIKICKNCGKEIKKGKYCSLKCMQEFKYKEKLQLWLKGNNFVKKDYIIPSFIKRYLFEKYENKCQRCGWGEINETTGLIPLQIHHKDGDCENNLIENLELLCPNCHSLTSTFGSLNKNSKRFHRKKKNNNTPNNN